MMRHPTRIGIRAHGEAPYSALSTPGMMCTESPFAMSSITVRYNRLREVTISVGMPSFCTG
jgi:hypothetical protein